MDQITGEEWEVLQGEAEALADRAAAETQTEDGHCHLEEAQAWLAEYARNNGVAPRVRKTASEFLDVMAKEGWITVDLH